MAEIHIITEAIYKRRTFLDETEREFITIDQLIEKLNSAREPGPPKEYILRQTSKTAESEADVE